MSPRSLQRILVLALITFLLVGCHAATPPPLRTPTALPLNVITATPTPTIGPSPTSIASIADQGGYFAEGQDFPFGFDILDANNQPKESSWHAACMGGFPCSMEATYLNQTPYETATYGGTAYHFKIAGNGDAITFAVRSGYADRLHLVPGTTYQIIAQKVWGWPDTFGLIVKQGDELIFQGVSDWQLKRTHLFIGCLSGIRTELVAVLTDHFREGNDCFGRFINTEIMFSQAGDSVVLHQGQSTTLGDYEINLDFARIIDGFYCPDVVAHGISFTISRRDHGETSASQEAVETTSEAVTFPDHNLEGFIRRLIHQEAGPILASDLEKLGCFVRLYPVGWNSENAPNPGRITDLRGLEYATNLSVLDLSGSETTDLSPLAHLTNLTELYLDYNEGVDLAPLQDLPALTRLWINDTQVSDLAPLSSLTSLQELYARHNQIADISALSHLTNLSQLNLNENSITDVSPLSSLTNLNELSLEYNEITNISPLLPLVNLTDLSLDQNQITDISALSSLINLTNLSLDENRITDISPLSALVNVRHLHLGGNQISDVSALAHLTQLRLLDLNSNQITDISPLVKNTSLGQGDHVFLAGNPLSADSVDVYLPQLRSRGMHEGW